MAWIAINGIAINWNSNKCRCEYKEFIDKGRCNNGSIWNPSTCECECDKLCDVGEYLDYANCKWMKNVIKILMEMKWFIIGFCMIVEEYASLVYYT